MHTAQINTACKHKRQISSYHAFPAPALPLLPHFFSIPLPITNAPQHIHNFLL